MTSGRQHAALCQLSAIRYRAVQAEMAEIVGREDGLRRNLAQLTAQKRARFDNQSYDADTALRGGADIRWHRWVDQRRATINAELAQVLAQKAECRRKMQSAFGRDQAMQALQTQAKASAKQLRQRRDRYES